MDSQTADSHTSHTGDSHVGDPSETASGDLLSRLRAADRQQLHDTGAPLDDRLRDFVHKGRSRVVVVMLARLVAVALPGRFAAPAAVVSVVLMGGWPYLLTLIVAGGSSAVPLHTSADHLFALATAVNNITMLALGWIAWRSAADLAICVSELLATSPQRRMFTRWLHHRLSIMTQLAVCAAGVAVAVLMMYAVSTQRETPIHMTGWLYLLGGWSGFLGGNVVYWLFTAAEVPLRLYRCENLRMAWIDPAHTPAVVRLCGTYARIAISLAVGVLITEFATIAITADRPPMLLRVFVIGFPVFAVVTALYVGVQPYITMARIVRRHIDQIVSPLMAQMSRPPGELLLHQDLDGAFRTYVHFRALRLLPVKSAALLQYVAGILASLVVYFIQSALT
ncbi:hypothetical protein [Actinomadura alba]|uniref:Uncharacterized protein n=1 Tax=Actinomadura alba TaxID=406431 RepID=A0ABR7M1T2_9ACTN|nr:hypothetical protein [Actinomadura alba]MBC6470970.1 hypothetical protein [Actinomadura alba]